MSEIHWARANSGNVFVTIAKQKGYFDEVGLNIIEDPVDSTADALTALGNGKVDVTSNQGTNNPLSYISQGQDFTIVGGYMLKGMYIVAKKGTGWNGVTDLVGKKFAGPASQTAITGALLKEGFDPINDVEWLTYSTNSDRLAAVVNGEADYAVLSGDLLFSVGNMDDIEICAWLDDLTPNYGCCRMNMRTDFVNENPVTVKLLLKALIKAECYFNANKEECVSILAKEIGAEEDYVKAYLMNENYVPSVDPVKNSVIETWTVMKETGFLDEDAEEAEKKVVLANNNYTEVAAGVLKAIGGKENVSSVDYCATRLRFTIKDYTQVDEKAVKTAGAAGVIRPDKTTCQVVIGTKVQFVYDELKKML